MAKKNKNKISVYLSNDILNYIIGYLDKKTFLKFILVCEKWNTIGNPHFKTLYKLTWDIIHKIPKKNSSWKDLYVSRFKILNFESVRIKLPSNFSFKSKNNNTLIDEGFGFIYRNEYDKAIQCFIRALKRKKCARAYEGLTRIYNIKRNSSNVIIFAEECLKCKILIYI